MRAAAPIVEESEEGTLKPSPSCREIQYGLASIRACRILQNLDATHMDVAGKYARLRIVIVHRNAYGFGVQSSACEGLRFGSLGTKPRERFDAESGMSMQGLRSYSRYSREISCESW